MVGAGLRQDALHHPGVTLGEWPQRELQRVASRRAAQWRDLLHPHRGAGADRGLAAATIPSARTAASTTDRGPRKPFHRQCRPLVPLRFTSGQHWRWRQSCTNNQAGPLDGGRSGLCRADTSRENSTVQGVFTKTGDSMVYKVVYEADNSSLTRTSQTFAQDSSELKIAKRRGLRKARVARPSLGRQATDRRSLMLTARQAHRLPSNSQTRPILCKSTPRVASNILTTDTRGW